MINLSSWTSGLLLEKKQLYYIQSDKYSWNEENEEGFFLQKTTGHKKDWPISGQVANNTTLKGCPCWLTLWWMCKWAFRCKSTKIWLFKKKKKKERNSRFLQMIFRSCKARERFLLSIDVEYQYISTLKGRNTYQWYSTKCQRGPDDYCRTNILIIYTQFFFGLKCSHFFVHFQHDIILVLQKKKKKKHR